MRRLLPARLQSALRPDAGAPLNLPIDFVHASRRRVRVAAAIGAGAYAVFLAFERSGVVRASPLEHRINLTHDVLGLFLCASLLLLTTIQGLRSQSVLAFALVVEVLLSVLISLAVPWAAFVGTAHVQRLTWVVPLILLFALLVPVAPRVMLAVSIVCAAAMPGGLWALASAGQIIVQVSDYAAVGLTATIAVAMASVASRTVYGAARQVAAARMIGSYELLDRLGQGGMGEVWRARHLLLARPAAVKLILPERLQGAQEERGSVVRRFTREAQVTADLRSPHTVQLFDFGVSTEGALYYVMELLQGMNAEHFVYRFGPIEPRRAVHWLRQVCHSLGEAHGRSLIHRDIKPANLFVCRQGRDVDFLKVIDFGLTKPMTPQGVANLTSPGVRMGTPGYMAPEQVFGLETGPATDLYAVGCVAYWLLTGVKPFDAASAGEILRRHAQEQPPSLSAKSLHPVPPRLEAIVLSCLSKEAGDRPRDAGQLSDDLGKSLDEAPWSPSEADRWWAKHLPEFSSPG